jgi:hypothetical protein
MRNDLSVLPWARNQFHVVENYMEAVGVMAAIKSGLALDALKRPIAHAHIPSASALEWFSAVWSAQNSCNWLHALRERRPTVAHRFPPDQLPEVGLPQRHTAKQFWATPQVDRREAANCAETPQPW